MLLACWISHVSYVSSTYCTSTCWILLVHAVIKRTSTICNRYTILYNPFVFNLFLASGAEQFCKSLCVDLELDQDDCRISIQDFNQSGVSTLKQKNKQSWRRIWMRRRRTTTEGWDLFVHVVMLVHTLA